MPTIYVNGRIKKRFPYTMKGRKQAIKYYHKQKIYNKRVGIRYN